MSERGQIINKLETSKENVEINKEIENTLNSVERKDDENLIVIHQKTYFDFLTCHESKDLFRFPHLLISKKWSVKL